MYLAPIRSQHWGMLALIRASGYRPSCQSFHKIRVPQCVATESTLHWHTQRKTLTKLCGRVFLRQLAVTEQFWFCLWRRKGSKHHHILREGLCLVSSRSKEETALRDETKQWLWMRLQEAWHQCSLFLPAVIQTPVVMCHKIRMYEFISDNLEGFFFLLRDISLESFESKGSISFTKMQTSVTWYLIANHQSEKSLLHAKHVRLQICLAVSLRVTPAKLKG